jgi:hypothetical protein
VIKAWRYRERQNHRATDRRTRKYIVRVDAAGQATNEAHALRPHMEAPFFAARAVQQEDEEAERVDERQRLRCLYPSPDSREQGTRRCRLNVLRVQYCGQVSGHMATAPISPGGFLPRCVAASCSARCFQEQ